MKKFEGRLAAVLGTIILHLLAAIIFMSFRISSLKSEIHDLVEVELVPEELLIPDKTEKPEEPQVTTVEKVLQGDEELLNIARNLANKGDPRINKDDYIDKVKEELIKSGKLGRDNFIDEQKSPASDQEELSLRDENDAKERDNKPDKSKEMEANYKGPTRIYYNLAGRTHTYLPIPIYKCQGQGKVVLAIEVTRNGSVEKAEIIRGESTTSDPCLIETAVSTALISRFNSGLNFPQTESGTLTYHFVAQ
jgi:hypothetical protein